MSVTVQNETKHTSGPWTVEEGTMCGWRVCWIQTPIGSPIKVTGAPREDYDPLPDARLIAAAPDLLDALKRICNMHGLQYQAEEGRDPFDAARAAIARTEGR